MSERAIPIDPLLYWKLNALQERISGVELRARQATAGWIAQIDAILGPLAAQHGFDPKAPIRVKDDECSLIITDTEAR